MKRFFTSGVVVVLSLFYLSPLFADSVVDGTYYSASGDNGRGACKLVISSVSGASKYGDLMLKIESSGEGACEWSAIGMSKNFSVTAGSITSGGEPTFVKLTFPFGPAGKRIQLTSMGLDGTVRNEEMFIQNELGANAGK